MLNKTNIDKVLEIIFKYPTTKCTIRQLARIVKISPPTALNIIRSLKKKGIIKEEIVGRASQISANLENKNYIWKKRAYNLYSIYSSGVLDYLVKNYSDPRAIILFGSYSRGDDIERSDIDIAIITPEQKSIKYEKFEKILSRKISIHEVQLDKVSEEFKSNLYNGIVLIGAI